MTTSGITSITTNSNLLLKSILNIAGICGTTQVPEADDMTLAREFMNDIIKRWQENGCELWSVREASLVLLPNQGIYDFTASTTVCAEGLKRTTLSANLAASATAMTVADGTQIADEDNVIVRLDDGTLHQTVTNIAPTGNVVTLAAGPASLATSGNAVYAFPGSKIKYPLGIAKAYFNTTTNFDQQVEIIGLDEYYDISNKLQAGTPTVCHFTRKNEQSSIYTWPVYSGRIGLLKILYRRQLEIMNAATDTFDFPQQGLLPLKLLVASMMALIYEYDQKSALLEKKGAALEERFFKDLEATTSITITPDFGDYV